jgi:TrmH family RNA methyltransferase
LLSRSASSLVRDLHLRRGRERRGLTLAEGVRLVEEAVAARVRIHLALASPALEASPRGRALKTALGSAGQTPVELSDGELEKLAATEHPQGVLLVVEPPRWTLSQIEPAPRRPVLVLDAVQDPGNVGTVIRTAHALGAAGLIALPGTAELLNPKTVRATMGALFRMPCVPAEELPWLGWCAELRLRVLVSEAGAALPASSERGVPLALVFGNEGQGIRESLLARADGKIGIPLRAGAESLNVSSAAAILLHEVIRD